MRIPRTIALTLGLLTPLFGGQLCSAVDYTRDIQPLLRERCASCHGALQQKAGLRLDTGAAARLGGKNGPVLSSESPDLGALLLRVQSDDPDERMPPEGEPLAPAQITNLRDWIALGAPSPTGETPERDPRDHWAFRPASRPAVPAVRDPSWIRNPIDAFIAAEHQRQGLQPSPEASRDVLLRRVHLDLTGLPPSREELHAFLADTTPDAYERAVDRLLDSPHHGERWARHWMDVWRYADWYGRRNVPDVWNSAPQIWRWRDWILRSLNEDVGYDRMLVAMLAADEVAPEADDEIVATGFLVRSWYALNPNQWRRDIVEHTGKAFLGLTFNCAHCHDHKYDPISHEEYFRFRAFFEPLGLRQDWVRGETDPGPFQRYDYSTLRKVVREGAIRVLDEDLEAKTHLYLKGDERSLPPGSPTVAPGVPSFLSFAPLDLREINLPPQAHHPGTKPWIRETLLRQATNDLATARTALAMAEAAVGAALANSNSNSNTIPRLLGARLTAESAWLTASNRAVIAQAEVTAVEARLAADRARFLEPSSPDAEPLMTWASHAERFLAWRKAQSQLSEARQALALREAEAEIAAARRLAEGLASKQLKEARSKDDEALAKAREKITQLTQAAEAANLALNSNSTAYTSAGPAYPERSTGRRRALAEWLTDARNPLTARVAVNHVWARHLHAPIVSTVFDFGRNGATPSHPELLDWLAAELTENGWSLQHLHRLIVTSSTYRQQSGANQPDSSSRNLAIDPDNRFLWRAQVGRLESELVRDAMLSASGDLDPAIGGPVLPNTEAESSHRRSLYFETFPEAGGHDGFTGLFDPPDPSECYRRSQTVLPQQALALVNSRFSHERSRSLAARLWNQLAEAERADDSAAFVTAAFEQILARAPDPAEITACRDFLVRQRSAFEVSSAKPAATAPPEAAAAQGAATPPDPAALPAADAATQARASLVRALFNHNDFLSIR